MQAVQIHNGFFLIFARGGDFVPTLTRFCEEQVVHWGQFQAIGAVEDVEIGYYDLERQEYAFRSEAGPLEVASMDGNVAEGNGQPMVPAHAVILRVDETLECIGAHLKSARIAATLELCLWLVSQPLMRAPDDETGLDLIQISV